MQTIPNNPFEASDDLIRKVINDTKIRCEVTKNSFIWFFYVYFVDYAQYPIADFQKEIFRIVEADDDEFIKIITSFRGSAKSTIITLAYTIWAILGIQQRKYVLIISHTQAQANMHFANVRNILEENELLKKDLGPFTDYKEAWGSMSIVLKRYGARISAASTEKTIRGARHRQYRPDLVILDDIEDINSVKTQDSRDKLYQWFTSEVVPLGDIHTRIIVVGNLLHKDSLLTRLQADIDEGKIDGSYFNYPLLDSKGKIQWPGKYPNKAAIERERRKVNDHVTWHREYLLEMVNDVDQVIHHDWIQTYSSIPQVILDGYHETICGVDFAASEKAKADHSALVSLIVAWHDNKLKVYVLPDPFYGRVTFPAFQEQIAAKYAGVTDSRPVKFIVESNGMQKGLVQILETAGLPVEAVHVSTDKRARVAMISPLIKSGQVEFHYMSNKQLITQLTGFGVEKYDDLVDALTIALNYVISDFKPIGTYGEYAYESAELWYDSPTAGLDEIVF